MARTLSLALQRRPVEIRVMTRGLSLGVVDMGEIEKAGIVRSHNESFGPVPNMSLKPRRPIRT